MALGEYRGPKSAGAFMRYAQARFDLADREEIYRVYVTESLRALLGSDASYAESVGYGPQDFDARQVVDDVISRAGLEVRK